MCWVAGLIILKNLIIKLKKLMIKELQIIEAEGNYICNKYLKYHKYYGTINIMVL